MATVPPLASRRLAVILASATIALAAGCESAQDGPACPQGTHRAPERQTRLERRLGDDPFAGTLVSATAGRVVVCFSRGVEPGVHANNRLVLAEGMSDDAAAARLAHLLIHVTEGLPWRDADPRPCSVRLAEAERRERRALELETALLRGARLEPDPGALDRVMAGYRSRCREGQASAQPSSSK